MPDTGTIGFEWRDGTTGFIDVSGTELEIACHGPSPKESWTIVMLHEGLGSVSLWRDFPKQLAAATGCGVFVYSRAGYGQSSSCTLPRPLNYMTLEAKDVLPNILDMIGLQQGILLGHSDGATIAAIHAGSVQDFRVRGLVLIAPHFFREPESFEAIAKARTDYETGGLRSRLEPHHSDVNCAFHGWCDAWLDDRFAEWDVSEVIDYFRVPVLAVQGYDDPYGTEAQINEIETRSYAPVETVFLEDCGHAPHREQPQATLAAIVDFTARLRHIEQPVVSPQSA